MEGNTADISIIADHEWYCWIKFYDPIGKQIPEERIYLGRYLGPAIDVGSAVTENILKSNGELVHCSTYRSLIPEAVNNEKGLRRQFDTMIEKNSTQSQFPRILGICI